MCTCSTPTCVCKVSLSRWLQFTPRKAAAKKTDGGAGDATPAAAQAAPAPAVTTDSQAQQQASTSAASAADPFAQLIEQAKAAEIDPAKHQKRRKQEQLSVAFGGASASGAPHSRLT